MRKKPGERWELLLAAAGARRLGWSSDDLPPSPIVYRRQARAPFPPATTNQHHHGTQLLPTTASFMSDGLDNRNPKRPLRRCVLQATPGGHLCYGDGKFLLWPTNLTVPKLKTEPLECTLSRRHCFEFKPTTPESPPSATPDSVQPIDGAIRRIGHQPHRISPVTRME
ncbi:hypothetical protein TIFTF001_015101 [Ficus carica]|uniref:Uncharacterized protein n=1 Tax=Ficus carica TaxID=3494 RepID=A0AA88A0M6_FICCA|nr:hypothetical protein TIFTF001_015101 [Ficus carica]